MGLRDHHARESPRPPYSSVNAPLASLGCASHLNLRSLTCEQRANKLRSIKVFAGIRGSHAPKLWGGTELRAVANLNCPWGGTKANKALRLWHPAHRGNVDAQAELRSAAGAKASASSIKKLKLQGCRVRSDPGSPRRLGGPRPGSLGRLMRTPPFILRSASVGAAQLEGTRPDHVLQWGRQHRGRQRIAPRSESTGGPWRLGWDPQDGLEGLQARD